MVGDVNRSVLALAATAVLALSLTACGGASSEDPNYQDCREHAAKTIETLTKDGGSATQREINHFSDSVITNQGMVGDQIKACRAASADYVKDFVVAE